VLFVNFSAIYIAGHIMDKIDRRIKRTHQLISNALVTLAQQDGYDAITIRDITDYADISYSTFFRHYPDKDSLLMSIMRDVIEELRELLKGQDAGEDGTILFQHVAENQALYRVLLGGLNSSAIVRDVQSMIITEIVRDLDSRPEGDIPIEIAANHIAASALALVKWWVDNDMPYSPERMGTIYRTLIMQPFEQLST
jgi:AcrR family transcriptional regulator